MHFLNKILGKKEIPITTYEAFWKWFRVNQREFHKVVEVGERIEEDFFDKISDKLQELKDGFFYAAGMHDQTTAELIVTADGAIQNIVFVEELVQAAPVLPGWKFTALKPAMEIENVNIRMADLDFTSQNISFYPNHLPDYPDEIDLTLVHDDFTEENKENITIGLNIFLDNYLGEEEFATTIDNYTVLGKAEAQEELVPISKLNSYLSWRQKEFIEKYDGDRHSSDNESYDLLEGDLVNGRTWIATVNADLLQWDRKASHPWVVLVEIKYDGENNNGMPDAETYQLLNEFEDDLLEELMESEGYLYIGRETADGVREIYFACKEFRKPSKVLHEVKLRYKDQLEMTYEIYKDKYWRSFNRFAVR